MPSRRCFGRIRPADASGRKTKAASADAEKLCSATFWRQHVLVFIERRCRGKVRNVPAEPGRAEDHAGTCSCSGDSWSVVQRAEICADGIEPLEIVDARDHFVVIAANDMVAMSRRPVHNRRWIGIVAHQIAAADNACRICPPRRREPPSRASKFAWISLRIRKRTGVRV